MNSEPVTEFKFPCPHPLDKNFIVLGTGVMYDHRYNNVLGADAIRRPAAGWSSLCGTHGPLLTAMTIPAAGWQPQCIGSGPTSFYGVHSNSNLYRTLCDLAGLDMLLAENGYSGTNTPPTAHEF